MGAFSDHYGNCMPAYTHVVLWASSAVYLVMMSPFSSLWHTCRVRDAQIEMAVSDLGSLI